MNAAQSPYGAGSGKEGGRAAIALVNGCGPLGGGLKGAQPSKM